MVEQGLGIPALAGCGGMPAVGRDARHDATGEVQRLSVQFGDAGHDVPPFGWSWRASHGVAGCAGVVTVARNAAAGLSRRRPARASISTSSTVCGAMPADLAGRRGGPAIVVATTT